MAGRRQTGDRRCPRCRIQARLCFCAELEPAPARTRVSFVVHFREAAFTSNTALLAHRVLAGSSLVLRGTPQDAPVELLDGHQALVLFPDEGAAELGPHLLDGRPVQLLVPDGSWRQAARMRRREPVLRGLPAVRVPAEGPSRYLLRQAPRGDGLCTLEAVARALEILDGPAARAPLERALDLLVERTLRARRGEG